MKGLGVSAYGNSIVQLLKDLETCTVDVHTLTSYARILDRHYVPARYPDAFTEGSPFEFYDEITSQKALDCAEKICDFCIKMGKKYE